MKTVWLATLAVVTTGPIAAQTHPDGPVEVPLRMVGGRVVFPVRGPGGAEFMFSLSLGSGQTVLSQSMKSMLGDAPLTLGGIPVSTEGSATSSDADLTTDGVELAGMVGANTLNQFDLLIDVPGERLVLKPFARRVSWPGMPLSDPVPLRIYHGMIISFDLNVNGKSYAAALDLGNPSHLVNPALQRQAGIGDADAVTIDVGGTALADQPIRVRDLEVFTRFDPNERGFVLIGAALVGDCAIAISWVHSELRTCVR